MDEAAETLLRHARAAKLAVPPEAAARLVEYLRRMLEAAAVHNLTAIRDPDRALVLHALDSLHVQPLLEDLPPGPVVDLGTGNGFPGVAAALLLPSRQVLLVERTRKKARAVEECLAAAGIGNGRVAACDGKDLLRLVPQYRGAVATVLARAVATPREVLLLAKPWMAPGGLVLHWREAPRDRGEPSPRGPQAGGFARLPDRSYVLPSVPPRQGKPAHDAAERPRVLMVHRALPGRHPVPPARRKAPASGKGRGRSSRS